MGQALTTVYPSLGAYLNTYGLDNLELCTLGPNASYYARWRNGRWWSWASEETSTAIFVAQSSGSHIKAIAMGYEGSYVISYGPPNNTSGRIWTLRGISKDTTQPLTNVWTRTSGEKALRLVPLYPPLCAAGG